MADKDTRPIFFFDFGTRNESEETLRTRLLLEAEICLTENGRPQRQMLNELRGYIVKNKGSDANIYPILRIIHRYLNVTPSDYRDLMRLIGTGKSLEFIDGVRPPISVWDTINDLRKENAPKFVHNEFWGYVLDGIERGEKSTYWYDRLSRDFLHAYRTNPDFAQYRNRASASRSA